MVSSSRMSANVWHGPPVRLVSLGLLSPISTLISVPLFLSFSLAQHGRPTGIFAACVCDNYTTGRGILGATEQVSIKMRVARTTATRRSLMSRVTYPLEAEATLGSNRSAFSPPKCKPERRKKDVKTRINELIFEDYCVAR